MNIADLSYNVKLLNAKARSTADYSAFHVTTSSSRVLCARTVGMFRGGDETGKRERPR